MPKIVPVHWTVLEKIFVRGTGGNSTGKKAAIDPT
jgi:hypothetical protein